MIFYHNQSDDDLNFIIKSSNMKKEFKFKILKVMKFTSKPNFTIFIWDFFDDDLEDLILRHLTTTLEGTMKKKIKL